MMAKRLSFIGIAAIGVLFSMAAISCNGGGKKVTGPGVTPTADVVIHVKANSSTSGANAFNPATATVAVGQTVQWVNDDNMVHTATADGGTFNTGNIGAGGVSGIITINGAAGARAYHCSVVGHNMTGTLNVTP